MKTSSGNEPLEFYLNKAYPLTIYPAEEGGYVAEIEELPGCITQGETIDEVLEHIEEARRGWIEVAYANGQEIPPPRTEEVYSGKFILRLPKYLHRRLAEQAEKEEVSLNHYIVALLSSQSFAGELTSTMTEILAAVKRLELQQPRKGIVLQETRQWRGVNIPPVPEEADNSIETRLPQAA